MSTNHRSDCTRIGDQGAKAFLRRTAPSLAVLAALAVLLGLRLHAAVSQSLYESKVEAVLRHSFEEIAGYYLASVRFGAPGAPDAVVALVRGPVPITAEQVADAERRLPQPPDGRAPHLRVRFVRTLIMTAQGAIADKESVE
ncbi:MAG TPA: hypothetical protein VMI72_02510 [Roseiarcus sp.]|nr:hypothetical protein [Roseiarcus sp.]